VVLSDVSGAIPLNNTAEWIAASRPGSPKPSGPIADFIARAIDPVTLASTTLIAESKGSLGSAVSAKRMKRAEEQLDATKVIVGGTTAILPLAFCSSIRFSKEKPDSCCQVIDPPPNSDGDRIALDPMVGWRLAYAKALRFVGMEMAAKQVFHGETAETIRPMDFDHERERKRSNRDFERIRRAKLARDRFGMELLLDVGECAVSVDSTVALVLRHGIHEESASKLSEALLSRRSLANERKSKSSFETALGLGCVFYSDLDEHHEH
jgi:hypothetical protein